MAFVSAASPQKKVKKANDLASQVNCSSIGMVASPIV
jgi:hypothetical protein